MLLNTMTLLYLILYWTRNIYDSFELLISASNLLKHEQLKFFNCLYYSVLCTFSRAIIIILHMAAKVSFTKPAYYVSTVLLHKMYYNIFQVYPESLKTQKNQTFSCGFLIRFICTIFIIHSWRIAQRRPRRAFCYFTIVYIFENLKLCDKIYIFNKIYFPVCSPSISRLFITLLQLFSWRLLSPARLVLKIIERLPTPSPDSPIQIFYVKNSTP